MPPPLPKKKNNNICQKFTISNYTILLTTLVETLPRSIHEFWEANLAKSGVFFQRRWHLRLLPPYDPILTKTKINYKNPKFEISQFFEQLWERPLLGVCMFFGVNLKFCVPSEEISFESFSPIWSHVNENEKKKCNKNKQTKKL